MKKQLLACTLALLSASTHGLSASASQPRFADLLGKVGLNGRFAGMPMKYEAFRNACVNASWLAKNPTMQKCVQDHFGKFVVGSGLVLATVFSFAMRHIYTWRNDSKFDKRFTTDAGFRKEALEQALQAGLLKLKNDPAARVFKTNIPLQLRGRYGSAGNLVTYGRWTNGDSHSTEKELNMRVSDTIRNTDLELKLHQFGAELREVGADTPAVDRPFALLNDEAIRLQLARAMANVLAEQEESSGMPSVNAYVYPVIDLPNEQSIKITEDIIRDFELLLTQSDKIVGRETLPRGPVNLEAILPQVEANRTYAVKQGPKLVGIVSSKLETVPRNQAFARDRNGVFIPRVKSRVSLVDDEGLAFGTEGEAIIDNITYEDALQKQEWQKISQLPFNHPLQINFKRKPNGEYETGEVKLREPSKPLHLMINGLPVGRESAAASSSNAVPELPLGHRRSASLDYTLQRQDQPSIFQGNRLKHNGGVGTGVDFDDE